MCPTTHQKSGGEQYLTREMIRRILGITAEVMVGIDGSDGSDTIVKSEEQSNTSREIFQKYETNQQYFPFPVVRRTLQRFYLYNPFRYGYSSHYGNKNPNITTTSYFVYKTHVIYVLFLRK